MRYLSVFHDLPNNRSLGKTVEKSLVELLEKKLADDQESYGLTHLGRLSKILIRHPESVAI
jgi:hypothetical protein